MAKQRIPYDRAPKLTPEQQKNSDLGWMVYKKEITLEQAVAQGYKEPEDDLFGMSQLMRNELD